MKSEKVVIVDPIGIHARPASMLSNTANKFKASVSIKLGDKTGNVKSIINLMALAVKQGSEIEIITEGEDEAEALTAVKNIMIKEKLI